MPITYEQLTELMLTSGSHFTIEEVRDDGKINVYRGSDVTAFIQKGDGHRHEHKVFDDQGKLIYHRDVNGKLYVSNIPAQWRKYRRQQSAGRAALAGVGIFRDSLRGALRYWSQGRR